MKKSIIAGVVILILSVMALGVVFSFSQENDDRLQVVATNFPAYDFARCCIGEEGINLTMLLSPGVDMHDYEPTPSDMAAIAGADLFIYNGGESEGWVEKILANYPDLVTVKMMDTVDLLQEDDEDEYDEHVWTSPTNAIKIVSAISMKLQEVVQGKTGVDAEVSASKITEDASSTAEETASKITENASSTAKETASGISENSAEYIAELEQLDIEIREVLSGASRQILVFGDRFPLKYFASEYGLNYLAAFPGCSEQTEVNAKTLSHLIETVRADNIPAVFKIELSNGEIAETIAEATGAKVLTFYSMHNISAEDFVSGKTYVDYMRENIVSLKEALE